MSQIKIRQMCLDDCKALADIDKDVFSEPLSQKGFEREYSNTNSYTLVAEQNDEIIGYANLWNICGEVTLNNIAVVDKMRNNGVGSMLLREALYHFSGCDFITLEVRRSNNIAIDFYKKFGFDIVGERKNFYRLPTEDALLMTLVFEDMRR